MLKQLLAKKHEELTKENFMTEARTVAEGEGEEGSHDSYHSWSENGENSISRRAGLPIVIQHEGGYCAALVELMATKRLKFDIIIPEQIIMMDQQQPPPSDDPHHSLLQRFSDHTQLSGRAVDDLRGSVDSPASHSGYEPGDVAPKTQGTHIVRERLSSCIDGDVFRSQECEAANYKRKAEDTDTNKGEVKRTRQSNDGVKKASSSSLSEESRLPTKAQESEHQPVKPDTGGPVRKSSQRLKDKKSSTMSQKTKQEVVTQDDDDDDTHDTEDSYQPGDVSSAEEDMDTSVQQVRSSGHS